MEFNLLDIYLNPYTRTKNPLNLNILINVQSNMQQHIFHLDMPGNKKMNDFQNPKKNMVPNLTVNTSLGR